MIQFSERLIQKFMPIPKISRHLSPSRKMKFYLQKYLLKKSYMWETDRPKLIGAIKFDLSVTVFEKQGTITHLRNSTVLNYFSKNSERFAISKIFYIYCAKLEIFLCLCHFLMHFFTKLRIIKQHK